MENTYFIKDMFSKKWSEKAHQALGRGWVLGKNTHTFKFIFIENYVPHSLRDRVNCGRLGRKGVWDGR